MIRENFHYFKETQNKVIFRTYRTSTFLFHSFYIVTVKCQLNNLQTKNNRVQIV